LHRAGVAARVLARIEKDVDERIPHFARRSELVAMMAIAEQAPATTDGGVRHHRDAREQLAHLRGEVGRIAALDHQVQVIFLNRVLHHAHTFATRLRELAQDDRAHELRAEIGRQPHAPHRHVHRMILVMRRTRPMAHESHALDARLAPRRNLPAAAPFRLRIRKQRELPAAHKVSVARPPLM
jgi:hypothetical protein